MNATDSRLRVSQWWARTGFLAAMVVLACGLRAVDPATLSRFPIRVSCGAVTGLPCIFCGTTRALHYLLRGEFAQALYFNWLAFVVAAAALALVFIFGFELLLRRRVFSFPTVQMTPRMAAMAASGLLALWVLQATLAVSMHKRELLNPNGLLYALFVK